MSYHSYLARVDSMLEEHNHCESQKMHRHGNNVESKDQYSQPFPVRWKYPRKLHSYRSVMMINPCPFRAEGKCQVQNNHSKRAPRRYTGIY